MYSYAGYQLLDGLLFCKPFKNKLPAGIVEMCDDVLEMDLVTIGKLTSEDHYGTQCSTERDLSVVSAA